jgi:hypothetical protein
MDLVRKLLAEWIGRQNPDNLARWAIAREDIVSHLRSSLPVPSATVPMLAASVLGARGMEALRKMTPDDARDLIRGLWNSVPWHAAILWAHEDWAVEQILRLRDALLGGR